MLDRVIAIFTMHFLWIASFSIPEATFSLNALGFTSMSPGFEKDVMGWDLFLLLIVMLALPLITIFLYKNRKLQLHLLIYTSIIDVLFYALFFFDCAGYAKIVAAETAAAVVETHYNYLMLFMPALSIFCLIMAMRGVIYDIALLKGLDRLR